MANQGGGEKKLSQECLEIFRKKSERMLPQCFGGFNSDDPVCAKFCAQALGGDLALRASEIREKLNEQAGGWGFFYDIPVKSCKEKRRELEEAEKQIKQELERGDKLRGERDRYCLEEGSRGIPRIPVGEVRWAKGFRDFTSYHSLFLVPRDEFFSCPYLPPYTGAVGTISESYPPAGLDIWGYVKSLESPIPTPQKIRVIRQEINEDGNLALTAKKVGDINGEEIKIILFGSSAEKEFREDNLGRL